MKIKALLLALFVAGVVVSMAIASPPPGKGKGAAASSTSATSTTSSKGKGKGNKKATSTTSTTTTTTTTARKTQLCHRTGSRKKPYVLISVASKSLERAHLAHGDVPATGGRCPSAGTTTTTTTASP